ncbi:Ig-like domain-containing protein [Methanosphaera sp. BMS]|uniref:Ig-like domain-containing protein n=1 Tax=Methanosphaera sp. BMS TaxID=1789762 RepID=UPI000DC1ED74|nr:Ig-like domain repeat protein [Methanosphaera sp. BMS]AWX32272.1 hypothetical protein AW729_03750 [Methanosphaera sp. BMS]
MNKKLKHSSIFLLFALLLILASGITTAADVDNDNTDISDNIITETVDDSASSTPQATDNNNNIETKTIKKADSYDTYTTTASESNGLVKEDKNLKTSVREGTVTANASSGYAGEKVNLHITAGGTALSSTSYTFVVTVKLNDTLYYTGNHKVTSARNGDLTWTVPDVNPGTYTLYMEWNYNNGFRGAYGTTQFTVLKDALETKISEVPTVSGEAGNTILPITVTTTNGAAITGSSTITVKDADTTLIEDYSIENGVANVSVPTTRTGEYELTVTFAGNGNYSECTGTIPVSVSKATTTLIVDQDDEGIYEVINVLNNTLLTGKLIQTSNNATLNNKELTINIDGVDYIVTTDDEGKFIYKYPVTQLAESVPVSIKFAGDDLYIASEEISGTFDIESLDCQIILDEDPLSEVNETTTISGKVTDNYNNPVSNAEVNLQITGVADTVTVTTDEEGKFSYDVEYNDVLEVTVTASMKNQALYEAETATMTFNVVVGPRRTNLTIETGLGTETTIDIVDVTPYFNEVITNGTLIDIFKEPVSDATIKILINGEDYSQTTDSEGKFTLTYNATEGLTPYNIRVEFEGNDAYKPAGEVYTGTFKTEAFDITVTVDENFPEEILIADEVTITGSATLQNQTLKNNEIVLTIDGKKYTTTTDDEGKYSYTYTVLRNGDIPVIANATFANADVKVGQSSFFVAKPAVNIDLDTTEFTTKVYTGITLNGRIYIAQNDTPIEDNLDLRINGKYYSLASDEQGNFNYVFTPEQAGTYEITVSYGNVRYDVQDATAQVNAIQRSAQIVNDKLPIAVKVNDIYTISGSLLDEDDSPIANAEVVFKINDETFTNTTDENGRYAYNYQTTKKEDNNQYEVSYSGDNNYVYAKNYVGSFFDVEAASAEISLYAENTSVNVATTLSGTVSDKNDNYLKNINVVIIIKNKQIQTTTNNEGMFTAEYTPTKIGEHVVRATIVDDNYLEESVETTFNSEKVETTTVINTVRVNENLEANLTASIIDSNNNIVPSGKLVFKINGKTIKDENNKVFYIKIADGQAVLPYTFTQDDIDNNVSISAVFSGSSNYYSSTSQKTYILFDDMHESTLTTSDITVYAGETVTFTAKVTDYGENINAGKVVFKINGKTIKDENNKVIYSPVENGIASCEYTIPETMKAKTYNITAVFTASQYNRTEANAQLVIESLPVDNQTESNETVPDNWHIITNSNVNQYITASGLSSLVSPGDTLDIRGTIDQQHSLVINKPINIVSTTKDAVINLHTVAGSLMGEDPGNCFVVNKAGSGSNISSLYLYNTECWIFNTHDVVLHNMTMYVKDQRVGSGVGQTAIRYSDNITLDSCFIYTENNGGSTSMALTGTSNILIKNTTIQGAYGSGQVGNILYLGNRYNTGDKPGDFTLGVDTNITIVNSTLLGDCRGPITVLTYYGSATNVTFINNTIDVNGSYGQLDTGSNGIATGNKFYGEGSMVVRANAHAYDNVFYGSGTTTVYANSNLYNNTLNKLIVAGTNQVIEHNTISSVELGSGSYMPDNSVLAYNNITGSISSKGSSRTKLNNNITIRNNNIGGSITLTYTTAHVIENNNMTGTISITSYAGNTIIRNNTIITTSQYAVTVANASTQVIDNYLVSNNNQLFGNSAVSDTTHNAIIANNSPASEFYTHIVFEEVTGIVGENINVAMYVTNDNGENTDGAICLKVNDELLYDEDGNIIVLEVAGGFAMLDNYIIPTQWLKSDTILTALFTNGVYSISESTSMNIEKMDACVEITTEDLTVAAGSQITLSARVTDSNGEAINGQLAFKLNGNTIEDNDEKLIFVDVVDGIATYEYTLPSDMTSGTYTLTAVFENAYYLRSDDSRTLTIE